MCARACVVGIVGRRPRGFEAAAAAALLSRKAAGLPVSVLEDGPGASHPVEVAYERVEAVDDVLRRGLVLQSYS